MKKTYEKPVLDAVKVRIEDVIATSSITGNSMFGDKLANWPFPNRK